MARPRKWRRVCTLPQISLFGPIDLSLGINKIIIMTVEEYESIRLMDLKGLNQQECAEVMGIARSTIQRIYNDARRKLADSMVNGKILKIEGGDYKLCSDFEDKKNCDGCICHRHRHAKNVKMEG